MIIKIKLVNLKQKLSKARIIKVNMICICLKLKIKVFNKKIVPVRWTILQRKKIRIKK